MREASALERLYEEWDALAVAAGRPFCSPAWMLAWWRHAAPPGAELRAVVVRDGGDVAAIAPFFADRRRGVVRLRLLGSGTSPRREPLVRAGREEEAATAFARGLTGADIVVLEGVPAGSPWPELLTSALNAWSHLDWTVPAPTLDLRGKAYEAWLASKSSSFRKQMRRMRRRLDELGATSSLGADRLDEFAALHHARWAARGGSLALDSRIESMLADVARRLPPDRFRLWSTEVEDRTISSHLFLAAGGEVAYWLGGFDDAWAAYQPALQTVLAAIEDALERGDDRLDLGPGGQDYKYRLADGEDVLQTVTIVPRGRRYARARAGVVPDHARRAVTSRVPERCKTALRRLRARR